ncbi:MAG: hypothetical protein ACPGVO_16550 [Spirulinaceae cyanobacterium]
MDTSGIIYPQARGYYLFTAIARNHGLDRVNQFLQAFSDARPSVIAAGIAAEPGWLNLEGWTAATVAQALPQLLARSPVDFTLADLQPITPTQLKTLWFEFVYCDLAYGDELMSRAQCEQLWQQLYGLFEGAIELFINRVDNSWCSTLFCTFDITIVAFSPDLIVILSFGDED